MKGGTLYIMSVEHHKTATQGVAKVVLDAVDHGRVLHYIHTIRMVQVGKTDSKKLFVLTSGRQLGNLSSKLKSIGGKYGLSLPSATRVRKIGATTVALTLGQLPNANLVTRQMSHTINTEALHYQAIVGDQHAASAFKTMSHLRTGRESTPVADSEVPSETSTASILSRVQQRRTFSTSGTEAVQKYLLVLLKDVSQCLWLNARGSFNFTALPGQRRTFRTS